MNTNVTIEKIDINNITLVIKTSFLTNFRYKSSRWSICHILLNHLLVMDRMDAMDHRGSMDHRGAMNRRGLMDCRGAIDHRGAINATMAA